MAPWPVSGLPRESMMSKLFTVVVACCVFYAGICGGQSAGNTLADVEIQPADQPGYEARLVLVAADGSVLRTLDLMPGEQLVSHNEEQVVFVRSDGTHFRLQRPFLGRPEPFDPESEASVEGGAEISDTAAVIAGLTAVGQIASWFFDSSSAPAPPLDPFPTPAPTPQATAKPTPTPEAPRVWTVVVRGDRLQCIDARTGSTQSTINLNGRVVSGPVVSGDYCTVTIESGTGRRSNTYKLPGLNLQNSITF